MESAGARLAFLKLNVPDMGPALAFWRQGFGLDVAQTFDEPDFLEHILARPGEAGGPNLLLVQYKDGRDVTCGRGHGPVGFACDDIAESHARAVAAGAVALTGIFDVGPVNVAMLQSPQGHEIELVQLPA